MDARTAQALVRFGLGRRGGDPLPPDPTAWLLDQIRQPDPTRLDDPPTAAQGLLALREDRATKPPPGESRSRALFKTQSAAQLANAVTTPAPFRERLVWFWTNHFTVSVKRGQCAAVAAAFIEEAIRPHVTARFGDMLLAVMRHPAMLLYLDNATSVGPDSPAGQKTHRGLNENLARECMELHTVSPLAGYSQTDVTSFAKILTGWSIDLKADSPGFRYRPFAHEPGGHIVLQHQFPPDEAGGVAALAFLANHPATHRFLATKLVRHFVADDPPPAAVRTIEAVLRDTKGDLGAASAALVKLDAAWLPGTKLRTPMEYVVASVRALNSPPDQIPNLTGILAGLGQPLWGAPAPNGWPDRAADWSGPEAVLRRVDWASGFAGRIGNRDVVEIAGDTLGPLLRPETQEAIRRAGSRRDATTLLLTSPEFQRR
ncbi:MAG TPA: DUF1800 domain-containing protein [Acetobacteraceae bacterium]|jgi:uncharacterized protein (DUF1800 family)|nr:DUF1800 domain-containing protein [Acetobacteraceae bacterium]